MVIRLKDDLISADWLESEVPSSKKSKGLYFCF